MKATILISTFICFSFIVLSSAQAYEENFDDGKADDWEVAKAGRYAGSTWKVDKGVYVGTAPDRAVSIFNPGSDWVSYTYEAKWKREGAAVFMTFYVQDEFNFYFFDIEPALGVYCVLERVNAGDKFLLKDKPLGKAADDGIWHTTRIELEEQKIKAFDEDGKVVLSFELPGTFTKGGIGLGAYHSTSSFDYVTLSGPGIPGADVEPAGKLTTTWAKIKGQ